MRPSTEIATALRWAGWGIVGFSALTLLVIILNIATGGAPDYGALIVPVLLATIGALVLIGARRVEDGSGPDAITLGSWAFKGFGILCIGIGVVMTFEDPMALLMLPFGAAFFGAGVLAKNIFGVPEGQKRIIIPDTAHRSHNEDGMAVQHRSGHIIHVDEDATEAEIEDSIRDWRRERLTDRKDWAAGRIEGESSRNFGWQKYAPMVTGVVALLMGTLAYFDGDLILWLIVSAFGAATVLATFHLFRDRQRLKAFGKSHLILDTQPAVIGQRL